MNRLSEIDSITFLVNGKKKFYRCVSGRLKYGTELFSIKCRIDGADGIDGICSRANEIEVHSVDGKVAYERLSELEIKLESATVSQGHSNTKYILTGKGNLKNA